MMFNPSAPRNTLRENVIKGLGRTTAEFAQRIGFPEPEVATVIACKARISNELATSLERAGYSTACLWLTMQENHVKHQKERRNANSASTA